MKTAGTTSFLLALFAAGSAVAQYPAGFTWHNTTLRGDNFQSHNQKIVWTANGLFRSGQLQDGAWHEIVERSTDGGATWTQLWDVGFDNRPPTVEADEDANVYVIYPDSDKTRFLKFSASNSYASPVVNRLHGQATSFSKFASFYDPGRGRLYHATQHGYLFTFDKSGNFFSGKQLFTTGSTGSRPSYPHLFVDEYGVLHYALTVADAGDEIPYETIRYLKSTDGGATWRKMNGTVVSTPVSCDPDDVNSTEISLESEETIATWLANMHAKNGKVHFAYRGASMHYMRFNGATGVREIDSSPGGEGWMGDTLRIDANSASFASDPDDPGGPLYAVGGNGEGGGHGNRLNALISYDNGTTWHDYARSGWFSMTANPGLYRRVTPDGKVVGCLATSTPLWATVNYFELPAYLPPEVDNTGGAASVDETSATLNGNLVSNGGDAATQVIVYYGPSDGGTTAGNWAESLNLGTPGEGPLRANVTNLTRGTTYYYRYYASNGGGDDWAPLSTLFVTAGQRVETSTVLTSSANPALIGSNIAFTATVRTNGVTAAGATGIVAFVEDGVTELGREPLAGGAAQWVTDALPYGTHSITAIYEGGGDYMSSTSAPLAQVMTNPAYRVTVAVSIAAGSDDAEESPSGVMSLTSGDLDMVLDETGADAGDQVIGLRFADLPAPPGAYVVSAHLQFTSDEVQTNAAALAIHGQAVDNAATFSASSSNVSSRALTTAFVTWLPEAWDTIGEAGDAQKSPDLAGVLQEILDRPGWVSSNAVAFIITGMGDRTADSFEKAGGTPARLTVTYDLPGTVITLETTVADGNDDAEESPSGTMDLTSGDLDIVHDETEPDAGDQWIGIRFAGLDIPRGWDIAEARIQFTAEEVQTGASDLLIRAQAADDAPAFDAAVRDISTRPFTAAGVPWHPPPWYTIGESGGAQETPDLSALLQDVVDRPGWRRGNAVAFIITGSGDRTADSFEKPGGSPPRLTVRFTHSVPPLYVGNVTRSRDGALTMAWSSQSGKIYTILVSRDLDSWASVTSGIPATGEETRVTMPPGTDPDPAVEPKLYFRIRQE